TTSSTAPPAAGPPTSTGRRQRLSSPSWTSGVTSPYCNRSKNSDCWGAAMTATPRQVFESLSQGITEGRWTELADLYAEDTVVEHPQRPPMGSRVVSRKV